MSDQTKSENELLYDKAMAAIKELFADKSVSQEDTYYILSALMDEIQDLISTLRWEI